MEKGVFTKHRAPFLILHAENMQTYDVQINDHIVLLYDRLNQ